jgi:AcrR family transcriptional regulator
VNSDSKIEPRVVPQLREKVKTLVRDELLQAAEGVFAEEGLQTAKVESIASRAGVSVGTVYNYFADRKGLVDAVMEHRKQELMQSLDTLSAQTLGKPFGVRLDAILAQILAYFHGQRPYYLLMMQAEGHTMMLKQSLMMARDPCKGPFGAMFSNLESLMAQGIAEGVLRKEPPLTHAIFLFGVTRGLGLSNLLDPAEPDVRDTRSTILRFFLHGAAPVTPGQQ